MMLTCAKACSQAWPALLQDPACHAVAPATSCISSFVSSSHQVPVLVQRTPSAHVYFADDACCSYCCSAKPSSRQINTSGRPVTGTCQPAGAWQRSLARQRWRLSSGTSRSPWPTQATAAPCCAGMERPLTSVLTTSLMPLGR